MKATDATQAFPLFANDGYDDPTLNAGLTKLEYFAAAALGAVPDDPVPEEVAKRCFDIAEAMLDEAERRQP